MIKAATALTLFILVGCSSFDEASYMPSEEQLQWKNPALLNCPEGTSPMCRTHGGRAKKSFDSCVCSKN